MSESKIELNARKIRNATRRGNAARAKLEQRMMWNRLADKLPKSKPQSFWDPEEIVMNESLVGTIK